MKTKLNTIKSKLGITGDPKLEYTWPALKLALTVLEKTLDGVPIPGLKGAIGGFLELAKTAEVSARTTNADRAASRRESLIAHDSPGIDPELRGYPRSPGAYHEAHSHFSTVVWSTRAPCRAQNPHSNFPRVGAYSSISHIYLPLSFTHK